MNTMLRKARGLLGMGLIWGAGFAGFMAVLWAIIRIVDPGSIGAGEGLLRVSWIIGGVGFISGILFGVLMSVNEARKKILELSLVRVALWGAAGAAAIPLLTGRADQVFWTCPLGAILAAGSVTLARRAELGNPAPSLLTADRDVAYTHEASTKELSS